MKIIKTPKTANKNLDAAVMMVSNSDGKILILRRGKDSDWMPNKWNFPGGGIEDGEDNKSAAIRECEEEAGITPHSVSEFGVFGNIIVFTGKVDSNDVTINFESSDSKWIYPKDASKHDLVESLFGVIKKIEKDK